MSSNAFERILSRLQDADTDAVTEKTASDTSQHVTSEEAMLSAVRKVADSIKTAETDTSKNNPVTTLETMAKEAAAREEELLLKTAQNMGAVICDGFFSRMAQYDTALTNEGVKVGSVAPTQLQDAHVAGYKQAQADMEKEAEAAFQQGYNETIATVHKTAAEIHYAGQCVARQLLEETAQ